MAVAAHGAYPAALAARGGGLVRVQVEEEVDRVRYVGGIAHVYAVHIGDIGHLYLLELAAVAEAVGLGAGRDDAHILALVDGHVAPPVHRRGGLAGVVYANAHEQAVALLGQEGLHAVYEAAHALVLIHAHHRRAVVQLELLAVHAVAGIGRVADYAAVPLHAAREPRVAQRQVAGLEHGVFVQQLAAGLLVVQRPEAAAQLRKEHGLEVFVFQYGGVPLLGLLLAVVAVLLEVWKYGIDLCPAHVFAFLGRYGLLVYRYVGMSVL